MTCKDTRMFEELSSFQFCFNHSGCYLLVFLDILIQSFPSIIKFKNLMDRKENQCKCIERGECSKITVENN